MASREYPAEFGRRVIILVESGRPAATARASRVKIQVAQDRFEILRVGEKTNHIDMVASLQVEPAARKALHPTGAQAVDAGDLSDPRRARARHALDVSQRLDRSVEETFAEAVPPASGSTRFARPNRPRPAGAVGRLSHGSAERLRPQFVDDLGRQWTTLTRLEPVSDQHAEAACCLYLLIAPDEVTQILAGVAVLAASHALVNVAVHRMALSWCVRFAPMGSGGDCVGDSL